MKEKTKSGGLFKGLTIKARFILFAITQVVIFIALGFGVYSGFNQVKKMNRLMEQINNIRFAVSGMQVSQNELFKEIQVNIEGLSTGEFESTQHLEQQYTIGRHNLESLVNSRDLKNVIPQEKFDSLSYLMEQYKNNYDTIVSYLRVKGYKDIGLASELEGSMFDLDNSFLISEDEFMTNTLLLIRTSERNYFLMQDMRYYTEVVNQAEILNEALLEAEALEEILVHPTLSEILGNYLFVFDRIIEIDKSLGYHQNEGYIDQQELISQQLGSLIQSVTATFNAYKNKPLIRFFQVFVLLLLFSLIITLSLIRNINRNITHSLKTIDESFVSLSKGKIPDDIQVRESSTEFGKVIQSLKKVIDGLRSTILFAKEIEKGNYTAEFSTLSTEDELGNALLEMRENLLKAEEERKKNQAEEKQLSWINAGTAKFAEILNQNYSDTEEFAYAIISNLVKYLEANQGGFFILNDENENERFLELKSTFAYDRRKFLERRIELGEGFVGTSVMEKSIVYRTEIPPDYITITSGLGDATPRVLLIVPLLMDEDIYGAIEIASFKPFEEYQLDFVKKISESVATTISSVKSREKTEKLLTQSQEQAEQIIQTEEEMRQNLEEMQATQEEATRRENQLKQKLDEANAQIAALEKKLDEANTNN